MVDLARKNVKLKLLELPYFPQIRVYKTPDANQRFDFN